MADPQAQSATGPLNILCLYAQQDEHLYARIAKQMGSLQRRGYNISWHAYRVNTGTDEPEEIEKLLNETSLILLLFTHRWDTADIYETPMMQQMLARYKAREVRVLPLYLQLMYWSQMTLDEARKPLLKELQLEFWNEQVFQDKPWRRNRDMVCFAISVHIRKVIEEMGWKPAGREKQATSKEAPWYLPYERNPYFTGREELLSRLHRTFMKERRTIWTRVENIQALHGAGGSGRTAIAIEYAHRYRDHYSAVLWAHASSRTALLQDYHHIARVLELPERDAPDYGVMVEAVKRWLSTHENWLLILDNFDDVELAQEFFPLENKGSVLFTTASHDFKMLTQGLPVSEMPVEEAVLFLLRRAGMLAPAGKLEDLPSATLEEARQLIQMLSGMPLALNLAGAYMAETACSLAEYRKRYLLRRKKRVNNLVRLREEELAALMCLDEITSPMLEPLHLAMSLDTVPVEFFAYAHDSPGLELLTSDPLALHEAMAILESYGLIWQGTKLTCTLPLPVRRVVREMASDAQKEWEERAAYAISELFPDGSERAVWPLCQRYMLLAEACVGLIEKHEMISIEVFRLLSQAGFYLRERGQLSEAQPFYQGAFWIMERTFGPQRPELVQPLRVLAELARMQNKYDQAESRLQRALLICEEMYGRAHTNVAQILGDLADLAKARGEREQAKRLCEEALTINEQVLQPKHPNLAQSLKALGALYLEQEQYEQAEPLLARALAINEQVLDPNDSTLVANLSELGLCLIKLHKEEQGLSMLERATTLLKAIIDPPDPERGIKYTNLAMHYMDEGKMEEAEILLQQGLTLNEEQFGPDHPEVATTLNNLASLYRKQGELEVAEKLFKRAVAIFERHPDVEAVRKASVFNNLACLYQDQGRLKESEQLFQHALSCFEEAGVPEHPHVAAILQNYAELLWSKNRHNQAMKLEERARAIREKYETEPSHR